MGAWVYVAEGFAGQAKWCRPILKATGSHGRFGKNRMAWLTHTHTHTHTQNGMADTHTHTHTHTHPISTSVSIKFRPLCFVVVLLAAVVKGKREGELKYSWRRKSSSPKSVQIHEIRGTCQLSTQRLSSP